LKDNFLIGSELVKNKDVDLLKDFIGNNYCMTELLYKATTDGFLCDHFHNKVDGKGAVIVLIKSKSK
jgi:hypothetical protein